MVDNPKSSNEIRVEYPELGHLILSHRDAVVYRIRQVAKDAINRLAEGTYDSNLFFDRILLEIEKSKGLFTGFIGEKSGANIYTFLEENFTQSDLRNIFDKMEKNLLLNEDETEKKYLALTGYIEIIADEVFSKLIRRLREVEGNNQP